MELLKRIFSVSSVAGYETEMKELIKKEISGFCTELYEDDYGNIIAVCGGENANATVINAPVSEDGFFVTAFDKGIAKCSPIGSFDVKKISGGRYYADGCGYAIADLKPSEKDGKADAADLSFDFPGCENISVGDILQPCSCFSEQNGYITGKSAGIKAAVYALINIIKSRKESKSFTAVFSVEDNLGFKGAKVAYSNLKPDRAYIIASSDCSNKATEISAGKGPVIRIMDKGVIFNKTVINSLLPEDCLNLLQREVATEESLSNNKAMYLSGGIPAVNINCPVKYKDTFNETFNINDVNTIVKILREC